MGLGGGGCERLLSAEEFSLLTSVKKKGGVEVIKERETGIFSFVHFCAFVWVILTEGTLIYISAIYHAAKIHH